MFLLFSINNVNQIINRIDIFDTKSHIFSLIIIIIVSTLPILDFTKGGGGEGGEGVYKITPLVYDSEI